ncbi:MAG: hypothetical protein ACHQIM_01765 [Sphingobacteriales bacterium]
MSDYINLPKSNLESKITAIRRGYDGQGKRAVATHIFDSTSCPACKVNAKQDKKQSLAARTLPSKIEDPDSKLIK